MEVGWMRSWGSGRIGMGERKGRLEGEGEGESYVAESHN